MPPHSMMLGESGRYRVASELLKRGVHVFFPCTDDGVDLFTERGNAIQVKSSTLNPDFRYRFLFRRWNREGKGIKKQRYYGLHPKVTHLVAWGLEDDVFWIIPIGSLHIKATLSIQSPKQPQKWNYQHKWDKFLNAWNLLLESRGGAK